MNHISLFSPLNLGQIHLPNRIVMAPMTRARTSQPGDVPNDLMAAYYAQRASAGLIISEATQISQQGKGYSFTPGIHTVEHIQGWQRVTAAVHAAGGRIFLQLWHVGRMSHSSFHQDGQPVAPSALSPQAQVWVVGNDGVGRMVDCPIPRALSIPEATNIVRDFRQAARNAMNAGFDGVEIHGGNGYLIDQFMRTTSNHRQDEYGGTRSRRLRLLLEIAASVVEELGPERVGVRLAPYITARNMNCPDIIPTILEGAAALSAMGIAYLHLAEADWDDAPQVPNEFRRSLRKVFPAKLMVAGRYDPARANAMLSSGLADLIAFGRPFVANPDLPDRIRQNWPLAAFDAKTLFGGGPNGYADYPPFAATGSTESSAQIRDLISVSDAN